MSKLTDPFLVLVVLIATLGCGDGESSLLGSGGQQAFGGQGGTGGRGDGPSGGGVWLYASDEQGVFPKDRVLDVQITMSETDWARLIATAKQEVWSMAYASIDGQNLGQVGFRPKGEYSLDTCVDSAGHLVCDKLSFKLKFNTFDPEGRFYGKKRLVLNQITDGWALYVESLGYQLYNDFGITAPRTSFAVLTVNGKSLGIYRVVEVVDGRFTHDHFTPGDGNLYKEAWPDSISNGEYASALETNEETASNQGFMDFSRDMMAASDAELPATLARYMDLDRLLDYMAVDYGIANWDGITTFYAGSWGHQNHNYYMYEDEQTSKFTLIPWDLNAIFFLDHWLGDTKPWDALDADCNTLTPTEDGENATWPAACDPTIRALALSKEKYHASVQRLLDQVFTVEKIGAIIDGYKQQVATAMRNDPFVAYSEAMAAAQWIKDASITMRSRLEAVLTGETFEGNDGGEDGGDDVAVGLIEQLCEASRGLDCYDEATCVSYVNEQMVAPLAATCAPATLLAYGDCLAQQSNPTTCVNGALAPNPEVCPGERDAILACSSGL